MMFDRKYKKCGSKGCVDQRSCLDRKKLDLQKSAPKIVKSSPNSSKSLLGVLIKSGVVASLESAPKALKSSTLILKILLDIAL